MWKNCHSKHQNDYKYHEKINRKDDTQRLTFPTLNMLLSLNLIQKYTIQITFGFILLLAFGCQKPEDVETLEQGLTNTTGETSIGSGATGNVSDYFYDFENDIDVEFYHFNQNIFNYSYDKYLTLSLEEPPKLTLKSFPDYLVEITPDSTHFLTRFPIDSLSNQSIQSDSVNLISTQFKNIESITWDLDAEPSYQRYKPNNSDWVFSDTTLYYDDTVNVSAYYAVVDTPLIDAGIMFVDSSEWRDTSYAFINESPIIFTTAFLFDKKQISSDSLFFRVNTDCNDNNTWDDAEIGQNDFNNDGDMMDVVFEFEDVNNNGLYDSGSDIDIADYNNDGDFADIVLEFEDRGNSLWDPEEAYFDVNGDGEYTLSEPYQDRNCNGEWDGAETLTLDNDGDGFYDDGDLFEDVGNGLWDGAEAFNWTLSGEDTIKGLYTIDEVPNNLIVDWTDFENPEVKIEINLGDDITDRHGNVFSDLIEEVSFTDVKQAQVDDIDSLVTLYTRQVVAHIPNGVNPQDYYVAKSEWTREDAGTGEEVRGYRYHLYRDDGHILQLIYPGYFLPPGFYYNAGQINRGFWHKNELEEDILFYTYNGLLRDGEFVELSYSDTTEIAIYNVEKSYQVDAFSSGVTVAAGQRAKGWVENDTVYCVRDSSMLGAIGEYAVSDCPGTDTTFYDCFRVTDIVTTTMLGSGVEFGQKVITYLAKGQGVIREDVYVRWTENPYFPELNVAPPDSNGHSWVGLSRVELSSFNEDVSGGLFRQWNHPAQLIDIDEFDSVSEFDFDPFLPAKPAGIQTLELREQ